MVPYKENFWTSGDVLSNSRVRKQQRRVMIALHYFVAHFFLTVKRTPHAHMYCLHLTGIQHSKFGFNSTNCVLLTIILETNN